MGQEGKGDMGHVTQEMEAIVEEALAGDGTIPYTVALSSDHRRKIDVLLSYTALHHSKRDIALAMKLMLIEFGPESKETQSAAIAFLCMEERC